MASVLRDFRLTDSRPIVGPLRLRQALSGMPSAGDSIGCSMGLGDSQFPRRTRRFAVESAPLKTEECAEMPTVDQLSKLFKAIASKDFLSSGGLHGK